MHTHMKSLFQQMITPNTASYYFITKGFLPLIIILHSISLQAQPTIMKDTTRVLCGTFVPDSSFILEQLTLQYWNIAKWTTPLDDLVSDYVQEDQPARPASRYFIKDDTLHLEMDKGFLLYKIQDADTLVGIDGWTQDSKLIRIKDDEAACLDTHTLTFAYKTWLRHSQQYFQTYYSTDYETALPIMERLCQEGYGPACMSIGLFVMLKDEEKGVKMLEKACEIGYFGNYACYRLGEVFNRSEKMQEAKAAYQKACKGGHAVGCMALDMME